MFWSLKHHKVVEIKSSQSSFDAFWVDFLNSSITFLVPGSAEWECGHWQDAFRQDGACQGAEEQQ